MRKISLKMKITLWYTLVMVIVAAVVLFAMNSVSSEMVKRDMTGRLIKTFEDMARQTMVHGDVMNRRPPMRFWEHGVQLAVYDENLNLLSEQHPFGVEEKLDFLHNELRTEKYNGKVCYVFDKQIHRPEGQSFWVRGVISNATENYAITSIMRNNTMLTVVLILVAAVGGYFIVKRALVPVNTIRKTAKEISRSNDLTRRINIGRGEDEICELANTFDEMLEQIEQAFEREKQFTSDASHELRTPTAVILSECEYMTECAKTPEEFAESAASVKRQAERMSRLVSELLTISRMDKKTQAVQFEKTDISELLSFVCDEQEELHEGKIVLKRNIASGVLAEADTFLLARLFINLISNGYQYSKNDGEICVSLSENENEIIVSVQDNGIGIAEEDLPKIWERFYQVDASRTQKDNGGMGLGLSIVNRIAKIHNGKVQVSSVLGSGSEFVFTMPKERK